ncbi:MAG TPA: cellulose synthase operon protein YhjQ/BcsQ [Phycisphaerales bacterium]|nr:cellulose synthase operon protein YhjQ/BcsQ [Phycisphaerales bacterium]
MTTIPASPGQALAHAPRPLPHPASGGASTASAGTVDPAKLLQKYKWALLVALVLGAVLGGATHFALAKFYPRWRPFAYFKVDPPVAQISDVYAMQINTDEMNRFMQTEARVMRSEGVLLKAMEDPAILREAEKWCRQYMELDKSTGIERFNTEAAARDLGEDIDARVIPTTNLIMLSYTYKHRDDATAIVRTVREKYQQQLREQGQRKFDDSLAALNKQIDTVDRSILTLQTRRETLINEKQLDDIEGRVSATATQLQQLNQKLIEDEGDQTQLEEIVKQMEAEKNSPAGPQFGQDMESDAEKDPVILDARGRISEMEAQLQSLLTQVGRDSRAYKQLESRLQGERDNIELKRKEVLRRLFDGELDTRRKAAERYKIRIDGMRAERSALQTRLVELNKAAETVADLKQQIQTNVEQKNLLQQELQKITAVTLLDSANRVSLQQVERPPTVPDFPKLKILVPAGMIITLALVAGVLFLRELVDQRVKGPSDIALIPRTRLLGYIPDASEDPAGQGAAETAFRDRTKGVVAESFRQLRGAIIKRIQQADHRTILVMSGLPGSGATTTVTNLGHAFAASDRKVLMIDANFRRPSLHRVLGLPEGPGLADALGEGRDFKAFVQASSTPNLDLLPVGSREHRIYERLSTQAMVELLAKARAHYDIVLVDAAPAIVAGDGLALAQKCDASILVVRALSEKRGMVARIKNELSESRAELLGIVVNGVRHAAGGYLKGNIKAAAAYQDEA